MIKSSFHANMKENFCTVSFTRPVVRDKGFISMEYEGKDSVQVVLKEGWSIIRGSFPWKCEQKVSVQVLLKEGWSMIRGSFPWKCEEKCFCTSSFKRGVVAHQGGPSTRGFSVLSLYHNINQGSLQGTQH